MIRVTLLSSSVHWGMGKFDFPSFCNFILYNVWYDEDCVSGLWSLAAKCESKFNVLEMCILQVLKGLLI